MQIKEYNGYLRFDGADYETASVLMVIAKCTNPNVKKEVRFLLEVWGRQ